MSFEFLYSKEQLALREEVRDFVKWVPKQMILDMDTDTIKFPQGSPQRSRTAKSARQSSPPKNGAGGGMDWVTQCMISEEVGTPRIRNRVCIRRRRATWSAMLSFSHGTDAQKEKYVRPLLRGDIFAAECLTEPRGGSDFFGATTTAVDKGDHYLLNGQKRFIVGGEGGRLFSRSMPKRIHSPEAKPQESITLALSSIGAPGVETKYLYGLMGCRGGGTARIVFKDAVVPKENVLRKGEWRVCRIYNNDDPRKIGNRRDDYRRGPRCA